MAKKEAKTDLWVYELLQEANIKLTPQGCDIKEINEALKTASKSNTGNAGYPEYCGVVKDFILVIEDKASLDKHLYKDEKGIIAQDVKAVKNYAVNGALFYARHLATKTSYNKVLAIGVSGNEKHHRITPIFVNERDDYQVLSDVETFISFSKNNIDEYYYREILHEKTDSEKTTQEVLKDAATLHEYLRSYGQPTTDEKPLIVSGIMLALREIEHGSFSIENLNGDVELTDGQKIYNAIETNLKRANVTPETKRDKLFAQFAFIKNKVSLNEHNEKLGKTPLRYYTEFLYKNIFHNIRYNSSSEDYIGRFYGEFMSYSGEDGQTLGIVLTPKHITDLFCDLIDLKADDKVLDPCCGTGGFLIAAMHRMINLTDNNAQRRHIKKEQLYGIEIQDKMFAIATTNMILRGDGNSNLQPLDFLRQNPHLLQQKGCTVGMMNPPYSQAQKTKNTEFYEINFTEHLLNSLTCGGRCIVIIPQSSVTGKTKQEQEIKRSILKHHTLEGVITLNKNTFYGVGTNPCIAVFTAGIPHEKEHKCKFINFEDDGFVVSKHIGLEETASAKDKRQHLLDVWFGRIEAETKFCVETTIEAEDEWLHAFYYFNDEIPTEKDFENTMADYLTFEFNMITHGRGYLFEDIKNGENNE
jgi:Type I restriction-modification system methyltransferase subunit